VIWIAIAFIIIGVTWGDPQPASSSTRHLPLQPVGLNDVDDDNYDNDVPLGAAGYIEIASIQSCVSTIEHLTAARNAALVDLSHRSRAPPRAPAEPIYRVVLFPTVFDRSEVCSASSFFGRSSLDLLQDQDVFVTASGPGGLVAAQRQRVQPGNLLRRLVLPAAIQARSLTSL